MRNKLIERLEGYLPLAPEEIAAREKILRFVKENESCFERSLDIGHITGSSWLISRDGEKALLMLHRKLGIWVQPGGHSDGNPDVLAVAIREAQEESGIRAIIPVTRNIFDLDVHEIPENKREMAHQHFDIRFLLQVVSDEEIVMSPESKKLQWFGKDPAALPTNHRSILRMHKKWVDMQKHIKMRF
jgi:8-oxo-dGTP pyrophosphatase MutT (NUDIX family)